MISISKQPDKFLCLLKFEVVARDSSRREVDPKQPGGIEVQEFVLGQAFDFRSWAVDGQKVIIRASRGRVLFEVLPELVVMDLAGSGVVEVTYVPDVIKDDVFSLQAFNEVLVFRVYRTSLRTLSKELRRCHECRVPFSRDL